MLPNIEEQAAIARMVERRVSGMTFAAIARTAESEGLKTMERGKWTAKTVFAILGRQQKLAA